MATSSDEIGRSARSKLSTIRSRGHVNIIHDASKVQYRVLLGVVPADQSDELIPKRCYQRDWLKFRFEESPNCEKPIGYKVGLSKTSTSNLRFDAGFDVHTRLQALTNRCPYYPDSLHDYPFVRRVFILFQALCCAVTKVLNQKFCESWLDHFSSVDIHMCTYTCTFPFELMLMYQISNYYAFQHMMSWVCTGQILPLQSSLSCASL